MKTKTINQETFTISGYEKVYAVTNQNRYLKEIPSDRWNDASYLKSYCDDIQHDIDFCTPNHVPYSWNDDARFAIKTIQQTLTNKTKGNTMNKYTYYKVIQGDYGYGWDDEDFHETDSSFLTKDRKAFKENLKAYRENGGGSYRVINRKELNI